uniref:Uncharacterized protein n=1 Tax=Ditylenchus dipsaci TaxID=166011 RepID=A0A915DVD7_9BILA
MMLLIGIKEIKHKVLPIKKKPNLWCWTRFDPPDEEDVHVLDESFAADSDATYEIVDESLEGQQESKLMLTSDDGANISEDELHGRIGQNDNLDDDEHDADQTEGARLQALHLANFHEEFISRLDALLCPSSTWFVPDESFQSVEEHRNGEDNFLAICHKLVSFVLFNKNPVKYN